MNSNNIYKKKFYLLLISGLIFLMLSYPLAFKKTVNEINSYKQNKKQQELLVEAPLKLQLLEEKIKDFEKLFSTNINVNNNYQVYLLESVTSVIKGTRLRIIDLPKSNLIKNDDFLIQTQQLSLQGSFFDLLRFLQTAGKDRSIGNICSVEFNNQKDLKTGINILKMKIYFQTINQDKQK